jgi:hypothetical protein
MMLLENNRDGRISQEKLPTNHCLLDRVDADQHGIIAPAELADSTAALSQRAFSEPTGR